MSSERAQRFLNELPELNQDLPCAPQVIAKLFAQTSPWSQDSNEDIARTIGRDQGLSARVLSLANSAFYGMNDTISSIGRAVSLLGLNEVRAMVLMVAAAGVASGLKGRDDFDLEAYWQHQVYTAMAAQALANALEGRADELDLPPISVGCECYTAGILHDIGQALTVLHCPDCWQSITQSMQAENIPLYEAEIRFWGLDHGLIGGMTLATWNLPPALTEPLTWHHAPEAAAKEHRLGASLLHCADALAHIADRSDESPPGSWPDSLLAWGLERDALLEDIAARTEEPQNIALLAQIDA